MPILDGSALPWVHLLKAAGVKAQEGARRILAVTAPVEVELGGKRIRASPYPGLRVSYTIDFAHPVIGHQEVDLVVDRESFERELAPARTFALAEDVERLHRRRLGLGGDLALVGAPVWAHVEVERGGHQLHFALRERPDCWAWLQEATPRPPSPSLPAPSSPAARAPWSPAR